MSIVDDVVGKRIVAYRNWPSGISLFLEDGTELQLHPCSFRDGAPGECWRQCRSGVMIIYRYSIPFDSVDRAHRVNYVLRDIGVDSIVLEVDGRIIVTVPRIQARHVLGNCGRIPLDLRRDVCDRIRGLVDEASRETVRVEYVDSGGVSRGESGIHQHRQESDEDSSIAEESGAGN